MILAQPFEVGRVAYAPLDGAVFTPPWTTPVTILDVPLGWLSMLVESRAGAKPCRG